MRHVLIKSSRNECCLAPDVNLPSHCKLLNNPQSSSYSGRKCGMIPVQWLPAVHSVWHSQTQQLFQSANQPHKSKRASSCIAQISLFSRASSCLATFIPRTSASVGWPRLSKGGMHYSTRSLRPCSTPKVKFGPGVCKGFGVAFERAKHLYALRIQTTYCYTLADATAPNNNPCQCACEQHLLLSAVSVSDEPTCFKQAFIICKQSSTEIKDRLRCKTWTTTTWRSCPKPTRKKDRKNQRKNEGNK